jgi:peptide chain release factor 2
MYIRFCEQHKLTSSIIDYQQGDEAGIKSATLFIKGKYPFGLFKGEQGIHRLVRISPFDSNKRRHTSFAAVTATPELPDVEVSIDPKDLKIDTYRASGAGGQHVNKTDSAIRITHLPTGEVVQCQSDRSQHKNRANAFKQLKSKLYELEQQKLLADKQAIEDNKQDIGWGSQIRSYVLDQSRIKDLRTNVENKNPQQILDGDLDKFIIPCLKAKTV